jgi:hypothetical protein
MFVLEKQFHARVIFVSKNKADPSGAFNGAHKGKLLTLPANIRQSRKY